MAGGSTIGGPFVPFGRKRPVSGHATNAFLRFVCVFSAVLHQREWLAINYECVKFISIGVRILNLILGARQGSSVGKAFTIPTATSWPQ